MSDTALPMPTDLVDYVRHRPRGYDAEPDDGYDYEIRTEYAPARAHRARVVEVDAVGVELVLDHSEVAWAVAARMRCCCDWRSSSRALSDHPRYPIQRRQDAAQFRALRVEFAAHVAQTEPGWVLHEVAAAERVATWRTQTTASALLAAGCCWEDLADAAGLSLTAARQRWAGPPR